MWSREGSVESIIENCQDRQNEGVILEKIDSLNCY